jgi:hypothetical protein
MADDEKIGKPWSDDELDAIVADYFSMLRAELSRQTYVKSHHSAVLMGQIGRTHRSVEFKHQNISAVLEEMGLPWIGGIAGWAEQAHQAFGRSAERGAEFFEAVEAGGRGPQQS